MGIAKWTKVSEFMKSTPTQSGYYLVAGGLGNEIDKEEGHVLGVVWYDALLLQFEYRSGGVYHVINPDASYVLKIPHCDGIEKFYHNPTIEHTKKD